MVLLFAIYAIYLGNVSELAVTLLALQKILPNLQQIYISISTLIANEHVINSIQKPIIFNHKR